MTRPMPGPPEHRLDARPHGDNGWCPICHHLTARRPCDPAKHLSDAEVAAEYWRAMHNVLRYDDGDPGQNKAIRRADTWHRFATHPHAFKETHNDRP